MDPDWQTHESGGSVEEVPRGRSKLGPCTLRPVYILTRHLSVVLRCPDDTFETTTENSLISTHLERGRSSNDGGSGQRDGAEAAVHRCCAPTAVRQLRAQPRVQPRAQPRA